MKSKNITKFDKKIPLTAASNVHRLAKDLGIDLNDIELSSNNSRLSIDDVKRHVKERLKINLIKFHYKMTQIEKYKLECIVIISTTLNKCMKNGYLLKI